MFDIGWELTLFDGTELFGRAGKFSVDRVGAAGLFLIVFRPGWFAIDACCRIRMYSARFGQLRSVAA